MEEKKLALEMLKELKANAKRWFIIAVIELVVILTIIGIFIWYIYQPTEETTTTEETTYEQNADTEGDNSTINQEIGE